MLGLLVRYYSDMSNELNEKQAEVNFKGVTFL
jgi:hypothetical protein